MRSQFATAAGSRTKPSSSVAETFYPPELFQWEEMPIPDHPDAYHFEEPAAVPDYARFAEPTSPGTTGRRARGLTSVEKEALERKVSAKQVPAAAAFKKMAAGSLTALGSEPSEPVCDRCLRFDIIPGKFIGFTFLF